MVKTLALCSLCQHRESDAAELPSAWESSVTFQRSLTEASVISHPFPNANPPRALARHSVILPIIEIIAG